MAARLSSDSGSELIALCHLWDCFDDVAEAFQAFHLVRHDFPSFEHESVCNCESF